MVSCSCDWGFKGQVFIKLSESVELKYIFVINNLFINKCPSAPTDFSVNSSDAGYFSCSCRLRIYF